MMCLAFIITFIIGFTSGILAMTFLPDDEPPTDWTNTGV